MDHIFLRTANICIPFNFLKLIWYKKFMIQEQINNCTCWEELFDMTSDVKSCNIGKKLKKWVFTLFAFLFSLAKDAEQKINDEYKTCKQAFIACSKLEDEALEYMIKCYTSAASIKANLKELLKIKDAATKLKTNQEAIVSTSQSSGRRVKRQKNSESVTCATYNVQVSTLTVVSIWIFCLFLFKLFQS